MAVTEELTTCKNVTAAVQQQQQYTHTFVYCRCDQIHISGNVLLPSAVWLIWKVNCSHLHDEEVRVVDVELHRVEEVGDLTLLHRSAVDQVLVLAADDHLASDRHLVEVFVTHRAFADKAGGETRCWPLAVGNERRVCGCTVEVCKER